MGIETTEGAQCPTGALNTTTRYWGCPVGVCAYCLLICTDKHIALFAIAKVQKGSYPRVINYAYALYYANMYATITTTCN